MSPKAGKLAINSIVSYLKDYKIAGLLGSPTLNYAGSIDLDAHYTFNEHFSIGAGVTNLGDKAPPT